MRCDVVAVGTELLLGQVVDTNSAWIGGQLALSGVDSLLQVKVGDNHGRIVRTLRTVLDGTDAVICCGGLGPTQDDITREAIAEVMGVALVEDPGVVRRIREIFANRRRPMPDSNFRQAMVPVGATVIPQTQGTAPGLICPVGDKVIYAVPGVPFEMREMLERAVLPDLRRRAGISATIHSRTLRTWGLGEAAVAELVAPRLDALDESGNPTIAFLASGIEGIKVRITAKAGDLDAANALLDTEEKELRALLGDLVFAVDEDNDTTGTMEAAVGHLLLERGQTLAVAESLTGGLIASRIVSIPGASNWFRGGIVSYASDVKRALLGVGPGPVVSEEAARAMAVGIRDRLGSDVGLSVTGVAGPDPQDGQPVGTVWVGIADRDGGTAQQLALIGRRDRDQVRQISVISALDQLRHHLLGR
ncbi:MAG: competence/damage-inducible protein A [Acidimicrobiaceae bacterium]|nr:competence/damage-inducible protein A [Acidimicrobiaceae bacterium]MBO0747331.1 competence/damage-inducible protein A [Acidimicrobiaceae bacterium]